MFFLGVGRHVCGQGEGIKKVCGEIHRVWKVEAASQGGKKRNRDLMETWLTLDDNHFLPAQDIKFMQTDWLER